MSVFSQGFQAHEFVFIVSKHGGAFHVILGWLHLPWTHFNKCCLVGFIVSFIPLILILSFCHPSCDSVLSWHWCMYTYIIVLDVCESRNIFLKKY